MPMTSTNPSTGRRPSRACRRENATFTSGSTTCCAPSWRAASAHRASRRKMAGCLRRHRSIPSRRNSCMKPVRAGRKRQRVQHRSTVVEDIGFEISQPVELPGEGAKILYENGDIVIGIFPPIAPRTRAEQHHAFEPTAVNLVECGSKTLQDWIMGCAANHEIYHHNMHTWPAQPECKMVRIVPVT